jgi:hypothetical protein
MKSSRLHRYKRLLFICCCLAIVLFLNRDKLLGLKFEENLKYYMVDMTVFIRREQPQ